jgi:Fic family protein
MTPRFQNLNSQLAEWQSLQPLKREDNDRLWRKLRLDWNYHSNHIEGNTLTYGETEILLIHGQATGDHGLRDYMEMQAHDVAIDHMKALVAAERPLTEGDIRDFNRILIKESFWKDAITPEGQASRIEILPGEYKKQPNNVRTASGEIFRFADPADVPIRMGELVAWLRDALVKKELHPIEIASKLHHDFVLIHPFGAGNGRTARILVNYVLMRSGYLPLVVPTQQKDRYLAALRRADSGDLQALTDYLAGSLKTSMDRGIAAAKGESIEEPDDFDKEVELFKRRHAKPTTDAPRRDEDQVEAVIHDSIAGLFYEFTRVLSKLDDLFEGWRINYYPSKDIDGIDEHEDTMFSKAYLEAALETNRVAVEYILEGFKGTSKTPFDVECSLYAHFNEFSFAVGCSNTRRRSFRYDETVSMEIRAEICKEAAKSLFEEIRKKSGEP